MLKSLSLAAVLLSSCVVAPAIAQQSMCDKRQVIVDMLEKQYKEKPIALGVTNRGGLIEVYNSKGGDTWTITVTTPDKTTCLVAAGDGWRQLKSTVNTDDGV